jgi:endonuclease/exonuclease/phosphatase family metal-dependent hydrolase
VTREICVALTLIRNAAIVMFASALLAGEASAQTTLTLTTADTQVTDATIGSGTAASFVYNTDILTTRASSDVNMTRRALLKFDTETTIPAGTSITSAKLTLYVKAGGGTAARRIGVYPVTKSFQETQATWTIRKSGYTWTTAGADLGTKAAEISVPATANAAVTVDVTALAKAQQLDPASRYTRIALVDLDAKDSTSYREFHSSETTSSSYRPKLEVVYGTAAVAPTTSGPTIKFMDWNTQYGGMGTDGVYNLERVVDFIVRVKPDIISLNELTVNYRYAPTTNQPAKYAELLKAKTGYTWYYTYRTDNGASTGVGNAVFSRFPIASTSYCQLSTRRVAVNAAIYVNGRLLNVWSTHLDSSSTSNAMRIAEVNVLKACTASFAEQKIIAGDFNAKAGSTEINMMKATFNDAWLIADAAGTAVSYPGNTSYGATRNARIDYVWYSLGASKLVLKKAEVLDARNSSGVAPSDHKPLVATYEVR